MLAGCFTVSRRMVTYHEVLTYRVHLAASQGPCNSCQNDLSIMYNLVMSLPSGMYAAISHRKRSVLL